MGKTNIVTPMWKQCLAILETGDLELADIKLMELVWKLADYTMLGYKDADKVEGTSLAIWKERCWYAIENNGLLPE
jgi:hypothetical protein